MMTKRVLVMIGFIFSLVGCITCADRVKTADGRLVKVSVQMPKSTTRLPCIIAAPGRVYHRKLPIFQDLAKQANAAGIAVITFDWHFFSYGKYPPSLTDVSREVADLEAVLAFAKQHPRVAPDKIVLAGKSQGSIVALRVFERHPEVIGLLLYTPVGRQPDDVVRENYRQVFESRRPVAIVAGRNDELNPIDVLSAAAKEANRAPTMHLVDGDHRLCVGDFLNPAFEEANAANVAKANRLALSEVVKMLTNRNR